MKTKKGIPVTSRGQWDFPGQSTIVPSPTGRITMKGVGYPVMGVDETGHAQMMMPGGEYLFPGNFVYEHPLMQHGGEYNIITKDNTYVVPQVLNNDNPDLSHILPTKPNSWSIVDPILQTADFITNGMQLGHFIPHPYAQAVASAGDFLGKGIDALQTVKAIGDGDIVDAAVNAAMSNLPNQLKKNGYSRPVSLNTGRGSGNYTPLSVARQSLAHNPVVNRGLNYNQGFLGATTAEMVHNTPAGLFPYLNTQHGGYKDNTMIKPIVHKKYGGWLDSYQEGGEHLPELNSKMDVANFYRSPLSALYGIRTNAENKFEYYKKNSPDPEISFDSYFPANIPVFTPQVEMSVPEYRTEVKSLPYVEPSVERIIDQRVEPLSSVEEQSKSSNAVLKYQQMLNKQLGTQLETDGIWGPDTQKAYEMFMQKNKLQQPVQKSAIKEPVKPVATSKPTASYPYWSDAALANEILTRQAKDNKWYGEFDKRGDDVLNRTDVGRNKDSEAFFAQYAKPGSVIIDIGSALGNNNPQLAGVSVYELSQNPNLKKNKVRVIATDIPSEVKGFEELKKKNKVLPIDYAEVPLTFNTPVDNVLKTKGLNNVKDVYLRAANSIDLLMNAEETKEHFKHISETLKDKNVTYVFNNVIMHKPAGQTSFKKVGNLANTAFDHRNPSWKSNKKHTPFTITGSFQFGGDINWLDKYN